MGKFYRIILIITLFLLAILVQLQTGIEASGVGLISTRGKTIQGTTQTYYSYSWYGVEDHYYGYYGPIYMDAGDLLHFECYTTPSQVLWDISTSVAWSDRLLAWDESTYASSSLDRNFTALSSRNYYFVAYNPGIFAGGYPTDIHMECWLYTDVVTVFDVTGPLLPEQPLIAGIDFNLTYTVVSDIFDLDDVRFSLVLSNALGEVYAVPSWDIFIEDNQVLLVIDLWDPLAPGTYQANFTIQAKISWKNDVYHTQVDDITIHSIADSLTVTGPILPTQPLITGVDFNLTYTIESSDFDLDDFAFSLTLSNASGEVYDAYSSDIFTKGDQVLFEIDLWDPLAPGTYQVKFGIRESSWGNILYQQVDDIVIGENDPPSVTIDMPERLGYQQTAIIRVTINDPEGIIVSFYCMWYHNGSGAFGVPQFQETSPGVFEFVLNADNFARGDYMFSFVIDDGMNELTIYRNFTITDKPSEALSKSSSSSIQIISFMGAFMVFGLLRIVGKKKAK